MSGCFLALLLLSSFILAAPDNALDRFYIDCPGNTNYTRGSAFQANLAALLSSLPGAALASSGFAKNVTGVAPNQAYGLAQCRGDVDASDCRACLDASVEDMKGSCTAGQKTAMVLYADCLVRHSNVSFFGEVDPDFVLYLNNTENATQPQFASTLAALMSDVTAKAAYASPRMFAAESAPLTPYLNIYGLAQCTRDLAPDDCNRCLTSAVAFVKTCCNGRKGVRVYYRSCFIRYEMYLFYDAQAAAALTPSATAPSPGGGPINGSGSKRTVRAALLVSIPVAVTLLAVFVLFALYLCKRNGMAQITTVKHGDDCKEEEEMRTSESLLYDLSILRAATDNFSEENKLGQGGFGPVYKGVLQNGQEIAVKRLSTTSRQGQEEMKNEVVLVAKLQHKNFVRVLGCCIQEHEKLLVYEFLSNNSLDKIIFDPARQHELSWKQRHKIIEGIGRGLLYLHEDSRLTIIHRDLKASNILLDADMNPKISDFGLAKLFSVDSSVGNTNRIAGTYGYMAPEYSQHGIFSAKSDVFSYGVLILEIVTGRRCVCRQASGHSEDLLTFVWRCWRSGSVEELLDGCPADGRQQEEEVLRCVHVGLLCVQVDPQLRPAMASVVAMLNSNSIMLQAPIAGRAAAAVDAQGRSMDQEGPPWPTVNEASLSELEPR